MAPQKVRISGNSFWVGRDRLGRHVRICLSKAAAELEVALSNIKITEMEESPEESGLLRIEASGVNERHGLFVRLEGIVPRGVV